ncbi:MAG: NAD-dependent epimerase/dehydratase family protein [Alphaproteobacteria bacterium]
MRILVTGGLGFIGSHLVAALANAGHTLTIIDDLSTGKREHAPAGSTVIIDDVARAGVFDDIIKNVDACYHLAAIASVERANTEWQRTHEVNLGGFVNLLSAIAHNNKNIPVVYASSAAVYGDNTSLPLSETSTTAPISAYGADKLACELQARAAHSVHGIPTIGLRFFNVYGERQDPASPYSGVISIFAKRALSSQPITIYGDGTQTRDFIYVGDVVQAITKSMDALLAKRISQAVFNVCTGTPTSINTLAETLCNLSQPPSPVTRGTERIGDIKHSHGDNATIRNALGFVPSVSLADGLARTLLWMKATS